MKKNFKNKYFILRHGQTTQQKKNKKFIYKWPDTPPAKLTKTGISQIKKAAKRLKKKRIDLIYSSDIYRTRQTSKIISKELGLRLVFDKRLRDVSLGIYHGRLKKDFFCNSSFGIKSGIKRFSKKPPKGESWNDVKKRLLKFLKETERKHKKKTILIISHGDPLWLLEGILKGFSNKRLLNDISKGNYIKVGELRKL